MTKLKTLLLLVLAGFILVACGSDEEEAVEVEVVDPRAEDKAAMALLIADDLGDMVDVDSISVCVAEVLSENLDDDAWTMVKLIANEDEDGFEEFMLDYIDDENALEAMGEALISALTAAEIECDVDLD